MMLLNLIPLLLVLFAIQRNFRNQQKWYVYVVVVPSVALIIERVPVSGVEKMINLENPLKLQTEKHTLHRESAHITIPIRNCEPYAIHYGGVLTANLMGGE